MNESGIPPSGYNAFREANVARFDVPEGMTRDQIYDLAKRRPYYKHMEFPKEINDKIKKIKKTLDKFQKGCII